MEKVKLAIIYYSSTGTNYKMSLWAEEAVKDIAEVRLRKVKELAPESAIASNPNWKKHSDETRDVQEASMDDLEWADAIIFSSPTRYGNMTAQMKNFLDATGGLWFHGKLVNKVVSAMSSAQNPHGGQEATVLSIYTTMYHWGAIVVAPGYTDKAIFSAGGNPYGTTVSVNQNAEMIEDVKEAVAHQARRLIEVAGWIKNKSKS